MSWWSCRSCFVEGAGLARTSRRSDRTGTGPLARLLLGHFHQLARAGRLPPGRRITYRATSSGAGRSFGSGRAGERRHPTSLPFFVAAPQTARQRAGYRCRSSSRHRRPRASAQAIGAVQRRAKRPGARHTGLVASSGTGRSRSAREWAARHRWVTALIIVALILVTLYAA